VLSNETGEWEKDAKIQVGDDEAHQNHSSERKKRFVLFDLFCAHNLRVLTVNSELPKEYHSTKPSINSNRQRRPAIGEGRFLLCLLKKDALGFAFLAFEGAGGKDIALGAET